MADVSMPDPDMAEPRAAAAPPSAAASQPERHNARRDAVSDDRHKTSRSVRRGPGWWSRFRLPLLLSLTWLVCLAGYAYGYFTLYRIDGAVAPPPTMNLLFFTFAAAGPLVMIWGAAVIVNRAGGLGRSLREQSLAAESLARELAHLRDSVDRQQQGIETKLAEGLVTLEKRVEASATEMAGTVALLTDDAAQVLTKRNAALDQGLSRIENTINTTISQRFQAVDETLSSTVSRIDQHLADQLSVLNQALDQRVAALDNTIADGQSRIAAVMEKRALGTDGYLSSATERMEAMLNASSQSLEQTLEQRANAIDKVLGDQLLHLDQGLSARAGKMETAFAEQAARIDEALQARASQVDEVLSQRADKLDLLLSERAAGAEGILLESAERLATTFEERSQTMDERLSDQIARIASRVDDMSDRFEKALSDNKTQMDAAFARRAQNLDEQNRLLETDIPGRLTALQKALAVMQASLAANPPASDQDLARRLGAVAAGMIAPERKAIGDMLTRVKTVEDQAREMLSRIDRTARLNSALDRPAAPAETPPPPDPGLPFADLAEEAEPAGIDWPATMAALELPEAKSDTARALMRAALDNRLVSETVRLAEEVQDGLVEEGLFVQDIAPVHAAPSSWKDYAGGKRSKDLVKELSGIRDDVALTLARTRLRSEPEFRDLALRFVASYQRLIGRAAGEIGSETRLLEMAETASGRSFILLAQLTGAFEQAPDPAGD